MYSKLIFLIIFLPLVVYSKQLEIKVEAPVALLMNAENGNIIFEKNAFVPVYPASTTKIGTALYILDRKKSLIENKCTVSARALAFMSASLKKAKGYQCPYILEPDGTHMFLRKGEVLSMRDLLFGLLIASGNDAANVLAENCSSSIEVFLEELNVYLKEIGCKNTNFCNSHGLFHPDHKTTAYDLALMAKKAMNFPLFEEIVGTVTWIRPETNLQAPITLIQHNKLLRKGPFFYPKAYGIKTGYIAKAKNNIVAIAKDGERKLIAVIMGSENRERYVDTIKLFEAGFQEEKVKQLLFEKDENIFTHQMKEAEKVIKSKLKQSVTLQYFPSEEPFYDVKLNWKCTLPIEVDSQVGELILQGKEGVLKTYPLFAIEKVDKTFSLRFKEIFFMKKTRAFFLGFLVLGILFYIQKRK